MGNNQPSVLVTGLSGLVGTRFKQLFGSAYSFENLDLSEGVDITNADQVAEVFKKSRAHSVIHLAAYTNVSGAHEQNGDITGSCYQVNVVGTKTIAMACQTYGKYLLHISTDYVFDGTKETAYTEDDMPHPIEWYGMTKLMAEEIVKETLPDSVILRLAFPYQANPMRPDFLKNIVDKLQNNSLPPAFTDHTVTPTLVDDVCSVFDRCLQKRPQGLYHMVGSSSHTDYEMATMIKEIFDLPGAVRAGSLSTYLQENPRPYQRNMKVSNQKLQSDIHIEMKDLREGLLAIKGQYA